MEALLEHQADIEAPTVMGQTPLFWAAGRGQAVAVELLLSRGAQVNSRDTNGDTPLHRYRSSVFVLFLCPCCDFVCVRRS